MELSFICKTMKVRVKYISIRRLYTRTPFETAGQLTSPNGLLLLAELMVMWLKRFSTTTIKPSDLNLVSRLIIILMPHDRPTLGTEGFFSRARLWPEQRLTHIRHRLKYFVSLKLSQSVYNLDRYIKMADRGK